MKYLVVILMVGVIVAVMRLFKKPILKWLMNLRAKLHIQSLRLAIKKADNNKSENGRKNIVVFDGKAGIFEPIEKKILKRIAAKNRITNNARLTKGRKRMGTLRRKKRSIDTDKVKSIEQKSLYVTD